MEYKEYKRKVRLNLLLSNNLENCEENSINKIYYYLKDIKERSHLRTIKSLKVIKCITIISGVKMTLFSLYLSDRHNSRKLTSNSSFQDELISMNKDFENNDIFYSFFTSFVEDEYQGLNEIIKEIE